MRLSNFVTLFSGLIIGISIFAISFNQNQAISIQNLSAKQVKKTMSTDIKTQLAQAVEPINNSYSELILDEMTEIETYPQSFLSTYQIYKVEHFNPHHPIVFYVGFATNKAAYLLTDNTANYIKLAQADNINFDNKEKAIEYVKAYLEVARSMSNLTYLVNSVDDVEFRPDLDDEETEIQNDFITKYRSIITQPTAKSTINGYLVTAYIINEQTLNEQQITVRRNGQIVTETKTLATDLPLIYGL